MNWHTASRILTRGIAVTAIVVAASGMVAAQEKFQGQVVSAVGGELALSVGGDVVRFSIAADAVITIDGQPAVLTDLTPDHVADVTARRKGDDWSAQTIEARSQRVVVQQPDPSRHDE